MTNAILIIAAVLVVILEFIRVAMDLYIRYQTNKYLNWIECQLCGISDALARLADETESDNEKYWNHQEKLEEAYSNGNSSDIPY